MAHKERITLDMTVRDAVVTLADGNIGALTAIGGLMRVYEAIDPDSAFKGFTVCIAFDSAGIYGSELYLLHNDVCQRDPLRTITLMRAVQLGEYTHGQLHDAIKRAKTGRWETAFGIDFAGLLAKVRAQLPEFGKGRELAP